jgi:hypothetical protein
MLAPIVMILWIVLVIVTCTVAWVSKDTMLRAGAMTILVGWLLTLATENLWPHWHGLHPGVVLIDVAAVLVFCWIAVVGRSLWAICACGFQWAAVGLHVSYWLAPAPLGAAYYTGLTLVGFLLGFSILAGAALKRGSKDMV